MLRANTPPRLQIDIAPQQWQFDLLQKLQGPIQDRQVLWYWSRESGRGKTTTTKWLRNEGLSIYIAPGRFELDRIVQGYSNEEIILFDLPRGTNICDQSLITCLEQVSDHKTLTSAMYQGSTKSFLCHVLVFSNEEAPSHMLPQRMMSFEIPELDLNHILIDL